MSKRWIGFLFVLASLVFSAVVYDDLPARVATHWDVHGNVNGWSSRLTAAFMMPVIAAVAYGVMQIIPYVLPRRENFARFEDTYWFVVQLIVAFLSVMNVITLGHALGWPINVPTFVLLGVGAMFMILGNVLPRTRSNWFLGIRTPWTLDSENVWRETHRLGGRTFVVGGLITMGAAFLPERIQPIVAMIALGIAGFIPVIYSFLLWRREQQKQGAAS